MTDDIAGPRLRGEDLLHAAATAGHQVSARLLETFRSQGLIPRPSRVANAGVRPVWLYPAGADRQLVDLMTHRTRTKDRAQLLALLWLDDHRIEPAAAREALAAVLEGIRTGLDEEVAAQAARLGDSRPADRDTALAALAAQMASPRGPDALPRTVRVTAAERAGTLETLIRTFAFGEQPQVSESDALVAERVLGISPGRRERVAGAGPSLVGPAVDMFDAGAAVTSLPSMARALAQASDAELDQARRIAVVLAGGLATAARMLTAATGKPNSAGLQNAAALDQDPLLRLLLVGMAAAMIRHGWAEQLMHVATAAAPFPTLLSGLDRVLDIPAAEVERNLRTAAPTVRDSAKRLIDAAIDGRLRP
ncbi:hypothetical protein [Kitasatospora purpeofusca]|uniref:hypothetical protein n=1 Tax=Kitasatospora purpeofusca TaxID=67352 RepID=UPI002A59CF11|nr:hypothetical protein [Kitasatospora purpeofusca]MDY0814828.1 hypothetical protein [Kitasatospora purpeofusca]